VRFDCIHNSQDKDFVKPFELMFEGFFVCSSISPEYESGVL
jgi:hypothetical protein